MQPGGIQDTFLGIDYQFKLHELFAHRSVKSGIKFKLSTELRNVGKLDDIAFEVLDKNGNSKFIFGQAKHKKDPIDFTYKMIMDSKEFQLLSYFDSFLLILPQKKYKNTECILIITNNKIDDNVKDANGLIKMDSNNGQLSLYFIEDTSDSVIFKSISKRFKFPDAARYPSENQEIFKNLKFNFVARKLVEFLLTDYNKNVDFCRQNRKFLFVNIFDEAKMEFRDEVLNGTDSRLDAFRLAFEQSFKDIASKKNPMDSKKWINDCWGFWKKESIKDKLKLIGSSLEAHADTDQNNFDKNLKLFMEKLVFVTDLKIKDIEERIKADLEVKYNLRDVSFLYGMIEKKIQNLVTKRGKSIQPIAEDEYKQIFEVFELFTDKIIVVRETEKLFEDYLLEFVSTHQDILNILDPLTQMNQPNNILYIRTQQRETSFLSMQIYSKLSSAARKDTFIIMKSSLAEADFKRGVRVFELDDLCEFLIIELDSDNRLFEDHKDCLEEILQNSLKRMIVISDVNARINLNKCKDLVMSHIYPKDLKFQDTVLNKSVKLQNYETTWIDLMRRDFLLNNVLLSDLLNTKSIAENLQVSKNYDEDLYISRTLECTNILKPEILKEGGNHEFVYSRQEFETKSELDPVKNVHWLENSVEGLKWIKSSNNNSVILQYIDDKVYSANREDSFADHPARVSILVDVAGMGKSTVLNYSAQQLKKKHYIKWIVKVDFNDYTKELDEAKPKDLETPQQAIEFLTAKIFKLDSDFEKVLFKQSCETAGKVILLFDGFDEVASYYKTEVSQLIESLLETSTEKIFVATRPEWATYLEREFKQIKHSLKPFSKKDQEVYLLNFMKKRKIQNADEDNLQKIIERILDKMSKSLNDQDYKITGVALITKLVAEFFEQKIREYFKAANPDLDAFIDGKVKNESFNLFSLYQDFFDKSLMIYFKDKSKMDPTNAKTKRLIENQRKQILKNYQKLAIHEILKTDHKKCLPSADAEKLDEAELEVLVEVGLVNKDKKFSHQTYGEFSFSRFLDEHFDDEECSKFIVEVVLVDDSYRIIRSFFNFWIEEKNSEKTFEIYCEKLLANSRRKYEETPLHVAGREGNENTFSFLYLALTKTKRFESEKTEIEAYLLKVLKAQSRVCYTAFVHYFQNCDDNLNLLNRVKKDFGLDFIKKMFTIEMHDKQKILQAICYGKEIIFKFLHRNFCTEIFLTI